MRKYLAHSVNNMKKKQNKLPGIDIDLKKHEEDIIERLNDAIKNINDLRNKNYDLLFHRVLEKSIEWYESCRGMMTYEFFREAFPTNNGPIDFYEGLYSFLVNVMLDDSFYRICWERYDVPSGEWVIGKPFEDKPYVTWSTDENGTNKPIELWEAMCYAENRDKVMRDIIRELDE